MTAVGDRLRRAAELIEQRAAEATTAFGPWWAGQDEDDDPVGPWWADQDEDDDPVIAVTINAEKNWARVLFMADWATGGDARWAAAMGPQVAEPLALWLRSEAIQFETDDHRDSPYGYPSWHFACLLLGEDPTDGGFDTLPMPEATP